MVVVGDKPLRILVLSLVLSQQGPLRILRETRTKMAGVPDNVALLLFFLFWYVGNAFYNQYNTMALTAVGGKTGGLTMTVSTMQLGVCTLYALVLWVVSVNPIKLCGLQTPERMKVPKITKSDLVATLPVGFCSAVAHSAGVFCLGADPLFGQIVKAGEPVMSALVNTFFYGKPPSPPKWVCLLFIVGGVAFASLKKDDTGAYKLKFDQTALLFGMIGNTFAAFKSPCPSASSGEYASFMRCWLLHAIVAGA